MESPAIIQTEEVNTETTVVEPRGCSDLNFVRRMCFDATKRIDPEKKFMSILSEGKFAAYSSFAV